MGLLTAEKSLEQSSSSEAILQIASSIVLCKSIFLNGLERIAAGLISLALCNICSSPFAAEKMIAVLEAFRNSFAVSIPSIVPFKWISSMVRSGLCSFAWAITSSPFEKTPVT